MTSFYQSLQAMSFFMLFSICASYCTLSIYSLARKNSKDIQPIVSSHVEAVVLLPWETNPWTVEVGMEAETREGKRVNYTGKA